MVLRSNLVIFVLALNFQVNYSLRKLVGLERLIGETFSNYNTLVRPYNEQGFTNIFTELKLLQIDLDEKYQELISTVWLEMTWEDPRIYWNPSDYDNITEITLPVNRIWVPDIVLQNGVGKNEYLTEYKHFNPWISHTGAITWVPEIRINTKCTIRVKDFPFDRQCCEINLYSWAHTTNQIVLRQAGNKNVTNITHLTYNTEWHIYDTCALNKTIVTSENLYWWVTSYIILIKRESIYHMYTLLMPCTVLSMLSMLVFFLPPESGEKITLGTTILLAFFVNMVVLSNYTPEATSELPVIGVYYIFNIAFASLSLASTICVLKFHYRGHRKSRAPHWLKKILVLRSSYLLEEEKRTAYEIARKESLAPVKKNIQVTATSNGFRSSIKEVPTNHVRKDSVNDKEKSYLSYLLSRKTEKDIEEENVLERLLKIIKTNSAIFNKDRAKAKHDEQILLEWKETARRLDIILFIVAIVIVEYAPIYLFGKYFRRIDNYHYFNGQCGCEYISNLL